MKLFIKISLILMAVAIFSSCSQTETDGFEEASLEIATKSMDFAESLEDADKEEGISSAMHRSHEDIVVGTDDDDSITDEDDEDDEDDEGGVENRVNK